MKPTDIPDNIPALQQTSIPAPEPTTETHMMRIVGAGGRAETRADDLDKAEVLTRAVQRITTQFEKYGITDALITLMSVYERMYAAVPGPDAVLVEDEGALRVVAA